MEIEELRKRLEEIQSNLNARQKEITEELEATETNYKASKTQLGQRLAAEKSRLDGLKKSVEDKKQGILAKLQVGQSQMQTAKTEKQRELEETERNQVEVEKKLKKYTLILNAQGLDEEIYTAVSGSASKCKASVDEAKAVISRFRTEIANLEQRLDEIGNVIQEVEQSSTELIAPDETQEIEKLEQTIASLDNQYMQKYGELAEQQNIEAKQTKAREEQEKANREAQEQKRQIEIEIQARQKEIQEQIQTNAEVIEKARLQIKRQQETREFYQRANQFYIDEESSNGKNQQEIEQCEQTIARMEEQIRTLLEENEQLEVEEKAIEDLLNELKIDNQRMQEEQEWLEYEAAQREEAEKGISDEEKEAYEEFLHEGYEQDIKDAENLKKYAERQDKGEIKWTEKEEPSQEDLAEQSKLTETPEAQKPPVKQPTPVPRKWKIVNIEFSVEGGMQPTYKIVLSKGREQKEFIATDVRLLDEELDREEIKKLKHTYLIGDVESYYDKGLATALQQVDEIYGTDGFEQYRSLIKDKEMIDRYPNRYINSLEISYDFSGLLIEPDENMKKLQKLAKANLKKGVVTSFKGRPNFLTRFIKKLFMKPLLEAEKKKEKEKEEIVACKEEDSQPEFASQAEYRMAKLKSRSEIFKIAVKEAAKQQPETEPVKEEAKEKQPIAEERKSEEDPKAPEIPQPKVEELLEDGTMSYTDKEGKRVTIEYEDWITEPDDEEEIEEDSRKYKGYGWPMGRVYKKDDEDEIDEDEEEIEL